MRVSRSLTAVLVIAGASALVAPIGSAQAPQSQPQSQPAAPPVKKPNPLKVKVQGFNVIPATIPESRHKLFLNAVKFSAQGVLNAAMSGFKYAAVGSTPPNEGAESPPKVTIKENRYSDGVKGCTFGTPEKIKVKGLTVVAGTASGDRSVAMGRLSSYKKAARDSFTVVFSTETAIKYEVITRSLQVAVEQHYGSLPPGARRSGLGWLGSLLKRRITQDGLELTWEVFFLEREVKLAPPPKRDDGGKSDSDPDGCDSGNGSG